MQQELKVGAKLRVSTVDGEEEDEVTRVLAVDAGVCVVETLRNGRVVVIRGRANAGRITNDD